MTSGIRNDAKASQIKLSNDDVINVEDSIQNVVKNIALGPFLAAAVMALFLRSATATLIGICAMPSAPSQGSSAYCC